MQVDPYINISNFFPLDMLYKPNLYFEQLYTFGGRQPLSVVQNLYEKSDQTDSGVKQNWMHCEEHNMTRKNK